MSLDMSGPIMPFECAGQKYLAKVSYPDGKLRVQIESVLVEEWNEMQPDIKRNSSEEDDNSFESDIMLIEACVESFKKYAKK